MPWLEISSLNVFRSSTQPAKIEVSSPPTGIRTSAVITSKASKNQLHLRQTTDSTIVAREVMRAALRRATLWFSCRYCVSTSWKEIVEVSAARTTSRKNIDDQSAAAGISAKINGIVSKSRVGPAVGSRPSTLNTAGKITIPESIATKKVIRLTEKEVFVRFVPSLN